ncbi:MAG: hypothetical protein LAO76_07480 [Acidobacteriia bacterium]|nr:hypothetical protein [Terriglobia bacterium]
MRHSIQQFFMVSAALVFFLVFISSPGQAQREQFQAQAFGEGQQMGQTFGVTITINELSTPEDQKVLIDAFASHGMNGLTNAISKMSSKGRIRMTGTLGYDVNYIRIFQTPTGRKIRLVTDRPITFGEAWGDRRSEDYSLSAIELDLGANGKGTGTLLPACQFKINKQNELEIEALRNPWRLSDVFKW